MPLHCADQAYCFAHKFSLYLTLVESTSTTSSNYKLRLTVSQVVRLIRLLLAFASQKIVHSVRDEMAEFVVAL